jgi:ferredoxin-NADP reductase
LTVERLDDGEVSPHLTDELRRGDEIELRGPIGGYFTWHADQGGPLLLLAGGSGLVPLMAMLRHHACARSEADAHLLVSARSIQDLLYRDEIEQINGAVTANITLTRTTPPGWEGFSRRVDADMLEAVGPSPGEWPRVFVCGPTAFVESAADLLVEIGHDPAHVHTERFGPTGG